MVGKIKTQSGLESSCRIDKSRQNGPAARICQSGQSRTQETKQALNSPVFQFSRFPALRNILFFNSYFQKNCSVACRGGTMQTRCAKLKVQHSRQSLAVSEGTKLAVWPHTAGEISYPVFREPGTQVAADNIFLAHR